MRRKNRALMAASAGLLGMTAVLGTGLVMAAPVVVQAQAGSIVLAEGDPPTLRP